MQELRVVLDDRDDPLRARLVLAAAGEREGGEQERRGAAAQRSRSMDSNGGSPRCREPGTGSTPPLLALARLDTTR
jgi:hypothetical protein